MDCQKSITILITSVLRNIDCYQFKKIDNNHLDYAKMALLLCKIIPGTTLIATSGDCRGCFNLGLYKWASEAMTCRGSRDICKIVIL